MNEKRFQGKVSRLRSPERISLLEIPKVIQFATLDLPPTASVLEVGAGTGLFAEAFSARGMRVIGIDANLEMVNEARKLVPGAQFEEGLAEDLLFENLSFDLVFMGLLLHEVDNAQLAMKEARRVCKKRLVILEWKDEEQPVGPPRKDRLSAKQITDLASQVGFVDGRQESLTSLTLYSFEPGNN